LTSQCIPWSDCELATKSDLQKADDGTDPSLHFLFSGMIGYMLSAASVVWSSYAASSRWDNCKMVAKIDDAAYDDHTTLAAESM
jgi:hypothetical protein